MIFRPMRHSDLDNVMAIEKVIYTFPWSRGNFDDSISSGYHCKIFEDEGVMRGYGVMMEVLDEAHLLNISVAREFQGKGLGKTLLTHFIETAKSQASKFIYLEVRPSNAVARNLYQRFGFKEISVRRNYYPAAVGREDALLMGMEL